MLLRRVRLLSGVFSRKLTPLQPIAEIPTKKSSPGVFLLASPRGGLEVRLSIQEAINEAWANSRTDPAAKAAWDEYFPDGRKPSVEAFIAHLGNRLSAGENPPYLLK